MQTASTLLIVGANLIVPIIYYIYFKQMTRGESTPNPATWIIWFAVMLMNAMTYGVVTGSLLKSFISITVIVLISLILIYALAKGKFVPLKRIEYFTIVSAIIVGVFWKLSGETKITHLLLQVILLISFVPTLIGLLKGTAREKATPWLLAVLAYSLQILALCLPFDGNWTSLAFPFLNGVVGNGSVAILAIYLNKQKNEESDCEKNNDHHINLNRDELAGFCPRSRILRH